VAPSAYCSCMILNAYAVLLLFLLAGTLLALNVLSWPIFYPLLLQSYLLGYLWSVLMTSAELLLT
jgi:hypothetical protein